MLCLRSQTVGRTSRRRYHHDDRSHAPRPTRALSFLAALALLALGTALGVTPSHATDGSVTASDTDSDYARMILVLDSSGSMAEPAGGGATKIEAARQALGTVVDGLPDEAYVGLRVYGATVFSRDQKGACTDSQLVVDPATDNRDELRTALAQYEPYGETPIGFALRKAAGDIGGESTRSIVLVSDGIATCEPDPCVVAGELAQQGIDLQIDVVGLSVDAKARAQLRCVAAKGNGTYYDADDADDIVESLQTATDRALRPFDLDGTPLAGGSAVDPTPVDVGLWSDSVGTTSRDAERWFSYTRTIPGSTVRVGISSLGGDPEEWDTVKLATSTPDGDAAASTAPSRTSTPPSSSAPRSRSAHRRATRTAQLRRGADLGVTLAEQPRPREVTLQPPGRRGAARRRVGAAGGRRVGRDDLRGTGRGRPPHRGRRG